MNPLISIIVPVYNVEKYLAKCVDSILTQSYKNIELILINDGSVDSSAAICDSYAEKDSRVRVIHKENGGVAKARNLGIENAKGEYFCFVDSDDYVHPEYIECMLDVATKTNADISMGAYILAWADGKTQRTKNGEYPDNHLFEDTGKNALRQMLYSKVYVPSSNVKLFKASKIKVHYPSYAIGEDMLASVKYYSDADNVAMSNKPIYYYVQHDESVMHTVNPEKLFDLVVTGDEMMKIVSEKCPENINAAKYYIIEKNMMALMKLYGMDGQEEKIRHIGNNIKKYRKTVIMDSNAEMRTRVACLVSFLGINTLCKIRNKITK